MAFRTTTANAATGASTAAASTSLMTGLRARLERWQQYRRIRYELDGFSDRQLADLGLFASDIEAVAQGTYRRS